MPNDIDNIAARLALADVVLAAAKESGLLRTKRRSTAAGRKAAATRAKNARAAAKGETAPKAPRKSRRAPLANVPVEQPAV